MSKVERDMYIERICAMTMGNYENKESAEKYLNSILCRMESDGIDFDGKDFKELFRWYRLGKPPKQSIENCERAIKKVIPDIEEEMLYRSTGFLMMVADALGGGETYDIYLAYVEGAYEQGFFDKENGKFAKKYFSS